MPQRPTASWRHHPDEQRARLSTGTLEEGEDWALAAYTDSFMAATDSALATFERVVAQLGRESDPAALGAVQQVVLALNEIKVNHSGATYDTDEREALCRYIDAVLVSAGVDTFWPVADA